MPTMGQWWIRGYCTTEYLVFTADNYCYNYINTEHMEIKKIVVIFSITLLCHDKVMHNFNSLLKNNIIAKTNFRSRRLDCSRGCRWCTSRARAFWREWVQWIELCFLLKKLHNSRPSQSPPSFVVRWSRCSRFGPFPPVSRLEFKPIRSNDCYTMPITSFSRCHSQN